VCLRAIPYFLLSLFPAAALAQPVASPWETYLSSAVTAAEQKKFTAAVQFIAIAEKEAERFNQNDPRLGSTYNTAGLIYLADNRLKEAEPAFRRALAAFEKSYGEKSLDAGNVIYNLSDALRRQGKYDLAEPLLRRVLETYTAVLGKDSPKVAQVYFWLGDTQRHLRNFDAAESNLKHAADMREVLNGVDSTDLAAALNSLALCYAAQNKYGQAEPLFKLSLNIREAKYGLNHQEVLESLDGYSAMLREAGRVKDSDKMAGLSDAIRKNLKSGK
jgi:tetratricopeptide (TPR) repeat protein